MRIMHNLQHTTPDMRPVRESRLVAFDGDSFLLDVHAEHSLMPFVSG